MTTVTVCPESETRSSRVSSRLQPQTTRYRVTLPPCETDGSSGHSNPPASKTRITIVISGSVGMSFPYPLHCLGRKLRGRPAHHRRSCRATPAITEISISRRIRRSHGHRRDQLGATAPLYNLLRSNAPSISARGCNPSPERIQRLPRSIQHHIAPSPLAQASVRNPLTLQKERTRKLQVHMGLAVSTTARLPSGAR